MHCCTGVTHWSCAVPSRQDFTDSVTPAQLHAQLALRGLSEEVYGLMDKTKVPPGISAAVDTGIPLHAAVETGIPLAAAVDSLSVAAAVLLDHVDQSKNCQSCVGKDPSRYPAPIRYQAASPK